MSINREPTPIGSPTMCHGVVRANGRIVSTLGPCTGFAYEEAMGLKTPKAQVPC